MHIKDSARLSYHYITEQDADFLWELDQDELVMKYINGGKKSSKEDIREIFVPRFQAYSNPALGWGLWRVETLVEKESIGWILVRPFGFFTQHPPYSPYANPLERCAFMPQNKQRMHFMLPESYPSR